MIKINNYTCKEIDKQGYMDRLRMYKRTIKKTKYYNYYNLFYDIIEINKN